MTTLETWNWVKMYQDKLLRCKQTAEKQQRPSKARTSVWVFFFNCCSSVENLVLNVWGTFHLQLMRGVETKFLGCEAHSFPSNSWELWPCRRLQGKCSPLTFWMTLVVCFLPFPPSYSTFTFVSTCRGTWPFVQCQALMWIIIKKQLEGCLGGEKSKMQL